MTRLLRHLVSHQVLTLVITENVIIFSTFLLAGSLVLNVDPTVYLLYDGGLLRILVVQATMLMGLHFHDMYAEVQVRSRIRLAQYGCQVVGIAFLVQAILSYTAPALMLPRWMMIVGCLLSLVSLLGWRILYGSAVVRALGAEGVLFLGDNDLTRELARHMEEHPGLGMRVLGCLYEQAPERPAVEALLPLGTPRQLREVTSASQPDVIVVGLRDPRKDAPLIDLLGLKPSGISIESAATTFERVLKRVPLTELHPNEVILAGELGPSQSTAGWQLVSSTVLALIGLLLAAPFMLALAAAVRLSFPGPVLHREKRVGLQGRTFLLYKFRSLESDAKPASEAVGSPRERPRVTALGRWLRLWRFDDLLQLINVLRGEMSFVGPRPEPPEFSQELCGKIPFYSQRLSVRPGLTGWAQINYQCEDRPENAARRLEYDLYYIKHVSLALNLYILLHSMKTAVQPRGAPATRHAVC